MADYDVITLDEAKTALNMDVDTDTFDDELAMYVTAVSERLDDLCGYIVARDVTDELHAGGDAVIWPAQQPVASITSVKEYASGVATTLTAETLTVAGDYVLDNAGTHNARIRRRSSWADRTFNLGPVVVSYRAGRFESTDEVSAKFKQAAGMLVARLWKPDQGAGSATFGGTTGASLFGFDDVIEMLANERKPPALA